MAYTVADYIIQRLKEQGVDTLFGVPSVYCARVYEAARSAAFKTIITSSDLEAGYAADGYARVRGLSAVAVSYGPGTLSIVNAIAGAYVERSPIVVINGGPSQSNIDDQNKTGVVYSHSMGQPHTDQDVLANVTAFHDRAGDVAQARAKVDTAIQTALARKLPVYIEIPQAILGVTCAPPSANLSVTVPPANAAQVARMILQEISGAKFPFLIVGVEVQRHGLATDVLAIIDKLNISWATTLLERTTIDESHALFQGVFNGGEAPGDLTKKIWNADLIVSLGAVFGSGHAAIMVPKIKNKQVIRVWDGNAYVKGAAATPTGFSSLISELKQHAVAGAGQAREERSDDPPSSNEMAWDGDRDDAYSASPERSTFSPTSVARLGISYDDLFDQIEKYVTSDPNFMLVADTFLGIYPAARKRMAGQNVFMANAIWASIGHSVGAGTGVAAANRKRPFIVCGDGGFQMTAQSLSTMARFHLSAITLVVDNNLYGYEQYLLDPGYYKTPGASPLSYATLNDWDYVGVAKALGIAQVAKATTVAELTAAIKGATAQMGPALIQVSVDPRSLPAGV